MRHVPLHKHSPDPNWQAKANDLLATLKAEPNAEKRREFIEKNRSFWGELKQWLLGLSHQKCWFSEAKDCFSHWEVEHFRPKKIVRAIDGTEHDGYWWLAFDWRNFRICGNAGNRKKGSYFPLQAGCARCAPGGDLRNEDPLLLDPADVHDPLLLSFNVEGRAIAAPEVNDPWELERVKYSVDRCNLDFPQLMDKRKAVWAECWGVIQEYLHELGLYHADKTNAIARDRLKQATQRVIDLLQEDRELSSVARSCVIGTGDDRVKRLLRAV